MTDCTSTFYSKNDTELLWSIGSGVICDENQIRQLYENSNRCGLHRKRNWYAMIDRTKYGLWWKVDRTMMWLII